MTKLTRMNPVIDYLIHRRRHDTHTAGAAIAVPLRILGQQPIQTAAPTPTMFIIGSNDGSNDAFSRKDVTLWG